MQWWIKEFGYCIWMFLNVVEVCAAFFLLDRFVVYFLGLLFQAYNCAVCNFSVTGATLLRLTSLTCHLYIPAAGRGRGCHPQPDWSLVPFWISARGIDGASSYWATAHGHSGDFRLEMVRNPVWQVRQLWSLFSSTLFTLHVLAVGATCLCQESQYWEWPLLPGSCNSTHCQIVRWEMWHQKKRSDISITPWWWGVRGNCPDGLKLKENTVRTLYLL